MHPYEMQRLIKQRAKDRVINVGQRANLYKTIHRLHRDGLIVPRETVRSAQRPERTVYEVTADGRDTAMAWLRDMLSAPREEFPEFPAAVSFLPMLAPDVVIRQLEIRRDRLMEALSTQEAALAAVSDWLPRLFSLEEEYRRAMLNAELSWVNGLLADLQAGRLTWSQEWLAELSARLSPPANV